jgi:hypothetical protein
LTALYFSEVFAYNVDVGGSNPSSPIRLTSNWDAKSAVFVQRFPPVEMPCRSIAEVSVMLDPTRPLSGTWAAWDVLDAIVCGSGPIPGAEDAAMRALLGGGTSLLVRSPLPPDDRWPWSQARRLVDSSTRSPWARDPSSEANFGKGNGKGEAVGFSSRPCEYLWADVASGR